MFLLIVWFVRVVDPCLIMDHILNLFSDLLAARPTSGFIFSPNLWAQDRRVLDEENVALSIPLSVEEIEMAINSTNVNSALEFSPSRPLVCVIIQGFFLSWYYGHFTH